MLACGLQLDFSHSKCASCARNSPLFLLGLILAYYTTPTTQLQASSGKCKVLSTFPSEYEHCGLHPDGVHGLDCFGKFKQETKCVWRPGNHNSQKTYTLITQQPGKNPRECSGITKLYQQITLSSNKNMTAEVFENSEWTNCTKAVFSGTPDILSRCSPPYAASFSRHSGKLDVDVSWHKDFLKAVERYSVRYKALDGQSWNKSEQCQKGNRCTLENLNSSLTYVAQIQCVTNKKCSQCPWSDAYTVASELTARPVIVNLEETDVAEKKGRRLLSLSWKFSAKEQHDGFYVTVARASGEAPRETLSTTQPEIRLILSYSAYQVNISAFNNASTSPAVSQNILLREDTPSSGLAGRLNITVHSNTSLTVRWKDDLTKSYVCYCVEWRTGGRKAAYMSFYEKANNHRTLSPLPEPLEPYKRYSITLHTRPDKDTCNMKRINNSESTYGTTQFYLIEGTPVSAPANISNDNVTLNSVALRWSSIPEGDIRGFLLGYVIYYGETRGSSPERNVTVDPELDTYVLGDLKANTEYEIQMSGFTRAGEGVRSARGIVVTNYQGYFFNSNQTGWTIVLAVLAAVLIFVSPIMKRAKVSLWPSIPHPRNSDAMQKIEGPCEVELLESISTLKAEGWDTNSLQLVEKDVVVLPHMLPSELPLLRHCKHEEDSAEMTHDWIQTDAEDATRDVPPVCTRDDAQHRTDQVSLSQSPFAFSSEYTTMEMFQQQTPQGVSANADPAQATNSDPDDAHSAAVQSELHYVRQFSTSPASGSEELSPIL